MADTPSSDDLIKQSKEALSSSSFDERVDEDPTRRPSTVADRIYQDREPSMPASEPGRRHPTPVPREPAEPIATPVAAPSSGGGTAWKVFGVVLLVFVGVFWALLLLGIALDPEDAGSALLGGVVVSAIPVGLAIVFFRRGARR